MTAIHDSVLIRAFVDGSQVDFVPPKGRIVSTLISHGAVVAMLATSLPVWHLSPHLNACTWLSPACCCSTMCPFFLSILLFDFVIHDPFQERSFWMRLKIEYLYACVLADGCMCISISHQLTEKDKVVLSLTITLKLSLDMPLKLQIRLWNSCIWNWRERESKTSHENLITTSMLSCVCVLLLYISWK